MKVLRWLIFLGLFSGCMPEAPDYSRNPDETMLAVSCGLTPDDSVHIVHVESIYGCSEFSNEDCGDLGYRGYGIEGAQVEVRIHDTTYVGVQTGEVYISYQLNFTIQSGDSIELWVTHPEYDPVWSSIIVPGEVTITHSGDAQTSTGALRFAWNVAPNAMGYDSHLYLLGVNDTSSLRIQLFDGFDPWESTTWDDPPSKERTCSVEISSVVQQVGFLMNIGELPPDFPTLYDSLFLQLEVWSLDETYYYTMLSQNAPDEYSGFSAHLTQFSNIENGVGVLGAFWITKSARIPFNRSLLTRR